MEFRSLDEHAPAFDPDRVVAQPFLRSRAALFVVGALSASATYVIGSLIGASI